MTDNEIIKALECCANGKSCYDVCPFDDKFGIISCTKKLSNATLDLINRQKAEIERLEKEIKDKERAYNDELCSRKEWQTKCRELLKEKQIIKSEAIKDFAEELEYFVLNEDIEVVEPKCKDYESYINGANQFRHQIKNGINNLVKEMTEVAK